MSSSFNQLLNFWEQGPTPHSQQQRGERATEGLNETPQTLDASAIDEQQSQQPPTIPARPQRPPRQRRDQSPTANQRATPPLTPERDAFQEKEEAKPPSPPLDLDTKAPLTPTASIHSSPPLPSTAPRPPHLTPSPPSTTPNVVTQQTQSPFHDAQAQAQAQQLTEERAARAEEIAALQARLYGLEARYGRAVQTAARNAAALRAELDGVRVQGREARRRQGELGAVRERERVLGGEGRVRRRRRRRRSGREEKKRGGQRHRRPQQRVERGCNCM